ncbi:hypothetical protein BMJ34_29670 [Sinorhizobium medicae]|uniref:histidine kinase n=2 Tax=Sinorhizobium medicae TaxID=110321 RepID=A0ABX4TSA3_9HYPH|nr:two-component sensor histidine kinase [Sinorhizobium medicae]MDX0519090.1 two-component sensor histidine kinase [Sinorhizobium medicae]MDX0729495.1 two-component sensor histidine kinase [Sinorhizobium medicae]MDX0735715.1 two-component sensor histidine kinase [Sinorhizobium medicae]MDX0815725.1 two-component sensor histidine kinase [Sinorhizobium medicae]
MVNSLSITRRLLMGLSVATLLFWISFQTITFVALRKADDESDQIQELVTTIAAEMMIGLLHGAGAYDANKYDQKPGRITDRDYAVVVRNPAGEVLTNAAKVLIRNGGVFIHAGEVPIRAGEVCIGPAGVKLLKPTPNLNEGFRQSATNRIYSKKMRDGNFIEVFEPLYFRRQLTTEYGIRYSLPLLVLLPVSVAIWWIVIGRALSPVEVLRQEIASRDSRNLSPLVLKNCPAELAPIVASVNRLVECLRTALVRERAFTAIRAHELKTPIAGARAQMQRLSAELPEGSGKERARGIVQSLSSLSDRVEKLLQLAQAESGIGAADYSNDLLKAVRLETEDYGKKSQYADRLILNADGCRSFRRNIDMDAFGILVGNLVENALKHSPPHTPVVVSVRPDGEIAIANEGPVICPKNLEHLRKPFRRGATPAAGSGLGLHIASLVIEKIGGSLELASPRRGRDDGFEAIVRIPQCSGTPT